MNRWSPARRSPWPMLLAAILACSDDPTSPINPGPDPEPDPGEEQPPPDNVAPVIAAIADRIAVRNTRTTRPIEIELDIVDPDDDSVEVTIQPDDETILGPQTFTCSPGACAVTLEPALARTASVAIQVTATDGDGGSATTAFRLDIAPTLVTTTADDGPGSLRAAVADAEPGDVIAFDVSGLFATQQTIELKTQITLDRVLTIDGPGADRVTVSGAGHVRVLRLNGDADVVIHGITIADGVAPAEVFDVAGFPMRLRVGGGVLLDTGARLTLSACRLTRSAVPDLQDSQFNAGGGIANFHGTLTIENGTVITGNTAAVGGGIANVSVGLRDSIIRVHGSAVVGNNAAYLGGGIYNAIGTVVLHGTEVSANTAPDGAGIWNSASLAIEAASVVKDNVANGGSGGGFYNTGVTEIRDSGVESNTAGLSGGGIYNTGELTLVGSTVSANTAPTSGGGIHTLQTATLIESRVELNVTQRRGGGIMNEGLLIVDQGEVSRNEAQAVIDTRLTVGGGGIYNARDARITGATIEGNLTAGYGAGIHNRDILAMSQGAALRGNQSTHSGGGLYNAEDAVATIHEVVLEENSAEHGGAVANKGDLLMQESRMTKNSAVQLGGAYFQDHTPKANSARTTIESTVVENNTAEFGGGVENGEGELTIRNGSVIADNQATLGGGIDSRPLTKNFSKPVTIIEASTIRDNLADGGGGIHNLEWIELRAGTLVQGNTARIRGGGALNEDTGTLIIRADARVTGNTLESLARANGGGIYNFGTLENDGDVSGNEPDDIIHARRQ